MQFLSLALQSNLLTSPCPHLLCVSRAIDRTNERTIKSICHSNIAGSFLPQAVAALPEHNHLFGELGCFQDYGLPKRECGKPEAPNQEDTAKAETPLDPSYYPLKLNPEQDQAWFDLVSANIQHPEKKEN